METEALVLDKEFRAVGILDTYKSFIWTDRYASCGDFEIYLSASEKMLQLLKMDYYLWINESEHIMIIEEHETECDAEEGSHLIIRGRSLESILDRRIIWNQTSIDGNLQEGIHRLLDENIINPDDERRKISNFIFEESTDPEITELTLTAQYTGDNLYEVICNICGSNGIGFKITLNDNNQFVFKLYKGTNRSYDQNENVYVVFSPSFENLINSKYLESRKNYKNVSLIAGEGEGTDRRTATVGSAEGIERRELYTDARDISSTTNEESVTLSEYTTQLKQRGEENLSEYKVIKTFDGEMDSSQMFVFGNDFYLGDIVQIKNEFNIESKARVTEMIHSRNASEFSDYPTFEVVEEKTNDTGDGNEGEDVYIGQKPTTLSEYGIKDSYTKTESDNRFLTSDDVSDITEAEINAICVINT